jgi:hypothetical protein
MYFFLVSERTECRLSRAKGKKAIAALTSDADDTDIPNTSDERPVSNKVYMFLFIHYQTGVFTFVLSVQK